MSRPAPATRYFAYGSNLNCADMRARCPDVRPGAPARLERWRLTFRGVADIEPAEGRTVHGALWWVTDDETRRLDRYEGAPSNYRQAMIDVETDGNRLVAMTYVMTHRDYLVLPSPWYLGRIEAGFEDWGLPRTELLRALRETRAELAGLGVEEYRPDGRKRPRAVLGRPGPELGLDRALSDAISLRAHPLLDRSEVHAGDGHLCAEGVAEVVEADPA